jgi:hypothetical protein
MPPSRTAWAFVACFSALSTCRPVYQSSGVIEQMQTPRTTTVVAHSLASLVTGVIAVAVGLLVSNALEPLDTFSRFVPIAIGALVAIGGGLGAARLVPWLLGGGLRATLFPPGDGHSGGAPAQKRRATHPQR